MRNSYFGDAHPASSLLDASEFKSAFETRSDRFTRKGSFSSGRSDRQEAAASRSVTVVPISWQAGQPLPLTDAAPSADQSQPRSSDQSQEGVGSQPQDGIWSQPQPAAGDQSSARTSDQSQDGIWSLTQPAAGDQSLARIRELSHSRSDNQPKSESDFQFIESRPTFEFATREQPVTAVAANQSKNGESALKTETQSKVGNRGEEAESLPGQTCGLSEADTGVMDQESVGAESEQPLEPERQTVLYEENPAITYLIY